jgi:transposase
MFIRRIHKKTKSKTYTSVYLTESYRENGKVKHRHISNLSKWSPELISNFEKLLKGEKITTVSDLNFTQGKSVGGIFAVSEVAKELGIKQALGYSEQSKLAMIQIAGRILSQGSRNYLAGEWKHSQAIDKVFKINDFDKYDLYKNLDWLSENQDKIEKKLFAYRNKKEKIKEVFLYDVTSSYLEGSKNELAEYGYNRDKKKGKKQIVIGLLTDNKGYPISVEVFRGNTGDTKTVSNQLKKLKENFGVERVVFVGDKGMVKSSQIAEIESDEYKWNYLTTITKQQIKKLISENVLQLDLFAEKIIEVKTEDNIRYILRRNPVRAEELKKNRQAKIDNVTSFISEQNIYLKEHKKAKPEVALKKINAKISKLKLKNIIQCTLNERVIEYETDKKAQNKSEELDGCYVVKTNVPAKDLDAQTAHDRYKSLADVEFAFRTMKTTLEEIRPLYLQKESRTRGHVFIVMLAYMIIKNITDKLSELNYSRKFIFESLDKINYIQYTYEKETLNIIPKNLLSHQEEIINTLNLKLK